MPPSLAILAGGDERVVLPRAASEQRIVALPLQHGVCARVVGSLSPLHGTATHLVRAHPTSRRVRRNRRWNVKSSTSPPWSPGT